MTASTDAALLTAPASIVRHYYLAMATPFVIDLITLCVYAAINGAPQILLPSLLISAAFLLAGVGIGAWFLIRPIRRLVAGEAAFAEIEHRLSNLPRNSAIVVGLLYAPMLAMRLLSHRLDITFGALLDPVAWPDVIASFTVGTSFNVVLTFFVVSAYLDPLCEFLFHKRHVNLGVFHGRFRRKVGMAVLFASFAGMILLTADIASYSGERLTSEPSSMSPPRSSARRSSTIGSRRP